MIDNTLIAAFVAKLTRDGLMLEHDYWDCGPDSVDCRCCGAVVTEQERSNDWRWRGMPDGKLPDLTHPALMNPELHEPGCLWVRVHRAVMRIINELDEEA